MLARNERPEWDEEFNEEPEEQNPIPLFFQPKFYRDVFEGVLICLILGPAVVIAICANMTQPGPRHIKVE